MEKLIIEGGRKLTGTTTIHGAKNAALPILAASLLVRGKHYIHNVPHLLDIKVMVNILRELGCRVEHLDETIVLDSEGIHSHHISKTLMQQMRSSIFLMGPLLARMGKVQFYQPGGCAIGQRKIDLHLRGLEALGATVSECDNTIVCTVDKLVGAPIKLDYPSVGATENIMMAAVLAEGTTTIYNAAREPEIEDLQNYLNIMGADITGAGTDTIKIHGIKQLNKQDYTVIPDRIVTGTLMIAAAVTQGNITLKNVNPSHLSALIHVLRRCGSQIEVDGDIIRVSSSLRLKPLEQIVTMPYPAFPTDLQAQIMVLLALSDGTSMLKETVFDGRFKHVEQLVEMGADIKVADKIAYINGVKHLKGSTVYATDLRAGAALIIAALAAKGTTIIHDIHHIDRGYDGIEHYFNQLGAVVKRLSTSAVVNQ
ncbi:UDP-N-acetylglucosamine 1-carboxyvinyltransferase [Longirhabdus pacifica]|uniref:UDP-N-acetylglucosamine 1-carboxyvinyltransferase n=1 Tax=Longirhabdus pacifica TaxID=2305227 RepID=UPI001008D834|nr:UDP-N-acetylglucosamine 1-carboxyvinyltransferase [Longirhabdus pacifica]